MNDLLGFRIGELAARSGRSKHAIRWYDAQGLIPGVQRDAAGQRRFNSRHVQWLGFVDRLRSSGMNIAQIRAYTQLIQQGPANLPRQRALLVAHREQVAATIAAWQESLARIDAKLAFYDLWISTGKRPAREPAVSGRVSAPSTDIGKQPRDVRSTAVQCRGRTVPAPDGSGLPRIVKPA